MKTREDVIEFSKLQMEGLTIATDKNNNPYIKNPYKGKPYWDHNDGKPWHYGKCEIMELIEYTYNDQPSTDYLKERARLKD